MASKQLDQTTLSTSHKLSTKRKNNAGAPQKTYYRNELDKGIKDKFLTKYLNTSKHNVWRHNLIELYNIEKAYETDFYNLTADQITARFKQLTKPSVVNSIVSMLDQYAAWATRLYTNHMEHNFFSSRLNIPNIQDHIRRTQTVIILHKSKQHFFDFLLNSAIDIREKMCIAIIYDGIKLRDIVKLRPDDVNFNTDSICYADKVYPISNPTSKLILQCLLETAQHITSKKENSLICDSSYLYTRSNSKSSPESKAQSLRFKLSTISNVLKVNVLDTDIINSAIMHHLMNIEAILNREITVIDITRTLAKFTEINSTAPNTTDEKLKLYRTFKEHFNINTLNIDDYVDYPDAFTQAEDLSLTQREVPPVEELYDQNKQSIGDHNNERGNKGELIVEALLKAKYNKSNESVRNVIDSAGYDFQVTTDSIPTQLIEVKTLYCITNTFHMSRKELLTAAKYPTYYWMYFVVVGDNSDYKVYITKNPLKAFNIPIGELFDTSKINSTTCNFSIDSYTLKLSDPHLALKLIS